MICYKEIKDDKNCSVLLDIFSLYGIKDFVIAKCFEYKYLAVFSLIKKNRIQQFSFKFDTPKEIKKILAKITGKIVYTMEIE